jgi:glycosyltransferase involved in cell wall biosynthesis
MSNSLSLLFTVDPELPVPPRRYGGIERIVASLVAELRRRGHRVGLAAHPSSTAEVDDFFPWPGGSSVSRCDTARNLLALARAEAKFRPDLVHSFSRIAYLLPLLLRHRLPKLMSYQREPSPRTTRLGGRIARGSLRFTGCSEHIAALGRRSGGDWTAIPNFIDPDTFNFVPEVSADAPLVFLSRLEPIKGCHTAIAVAKAAGRRLLIAGNRVESGSSAGYWEREIAPHLGRDGIEYVGEVDDKQKNALLGRAAAMVVPIEWEEPFGIVFAEALACGTPVIACPRGAVPEIVADGVHGFHIRSVAEGAAAVARIGELSRAECRRRVEERFTVARVADQYEALYRKLVAPTASRP